MLNLLREFTLNPKFISHERFVSVHIEEQLVRQIARSTWNAYNFYSVWIYEFMNVGLKPAKKKYYGRPAAKTQASLSPAFVP